MTTPKESAIKFPCKFPIKAIGKRHPDLEKTVRDIIEKHTAHTQHVIEIRPSKQQNYHALTLTITAHSQAQLDQIYSELNASALIVMTL